MAVPWLGPRATTRVVVAFGLALRLWHYAVNHTIWYDEAVLLANILGKSYARLLGPLDHAVAAPPLFLWGFKLLADLCGDEPYAWRFVPFACSCGTLLLTVPLARRVLSPSVAVLAVALVAVSDNHVWLGCCVKPYAGDALLATALLYFHEATRTWPAPRRLTLMALAIPPVLAASYPAAFVIGGVLLALGPPACRAGWRGLAAWVGSALAAVATFAWLYFGPVRNQRVGGLVTEWERMFPDFHNPGTIPWWVVEHTATVFQFCYNPVGFYLGAVAPLGIASAWRRGRRDLVVLLVSPFLLAMAAAALKSYPYGFNRLMFFIAPCALLLGGLGIDDLARRLPSKRLYRATAALLVLVGLGIQIDHLFRARAQPDSSSTAEYIRTHRLEGDRVASDEPTYVYFFAGELESLDGIAATAPPGTRVWVPMDFYDPELRRNYVSEKLAPGGLRLVGEVLFRDASAFLFERPR